MADGVVESNGLRALEGLVFQGAADGEALLGVLDGDEAASEMTGLVEWFKGC